MGKIEQFEFKKLSKKLTVLYVEDDKKISIKFKAFLEEVFLRCDVAYDGKMGLEIYENFEYKENRFYDIVITDIIMPYMNGIVLCEKILQINPIQKIIVISAYGDKKELIQLINMGIKRFIEKPFNAKEIISQLDSMLKEISEDLPKYNLILKENLIWNSMKRELSYCSKRIHLSYNEIIILELFIHNRYQIFSNFDIFNILEDENPDKIFSQDIIKTSIKRLRQKLPFNIIQNIYGIGYKLQID
jgi:DNA-binding response OmpR family regulator